MISIAKVLKRKLYPINLGRGWGVGVNKGYNSLPANFFLNLVMIALGGIAYH